MATIDCDANALVQASACLDRCIPRGMHQAIQTYLLQQIAGNTMTPDELMQAAACFTKCVPPRVLSDIQTYLLCQIVNSE